MHRSHTATGSWLLLVASTCCIPNLKAAAWHVQADSSTLGFQSQYEGEVFNGRFLRYDAQLNVDAVNPAATRIVVDIDLNSVDTQNPERDGMLRSADFFWVEKFPHARFETKRCERGPSPGTQSCAAQLTLRGKVTELHFPFTWSPSGNGARLKARVTLDRLALSVGTGDWADVGLIPRAVDVQVDLQLLPAATH